MELLVPIGESQDLRRSLAVALTMLANGEIGLGSRKRRGFGACKIGDWRVWYYDLKSKAGLLGSLSHDHPEWETAVPPRIGKDICQLLDVPDALGEVEDHRSYFELSGNFDLESGLLIRSGFESLTGPDAMQLRSHRPGTDNPVPVIPGTSLAGALRDRALRIAHTVAQASSCIA